MPESVRCPRCGAPVEITAALEAQVRTEVEGHLKAEADRRVKDAAAKAAAEAKAAATLEQEDLAKQLRASRAETAALKQTELGLRREREALEQEKKDQELVVQRRLDEGRRRVEEQARKAADEAHALKDRENQARIESMMRTIEDLKRKAEQGSQQLQGEVLETSLEDLLRREFPGDLIEPVPKGVRGADLVQRVRDRRGEVCGTILWESKRTKAWVAEWTAKLKDDLRAMKAQVAALVSQVLPAGAGPVSLVDDVWVATPAAAAGLAQVLRRGLVEMADERRAQEGRTEKEALLYGYLTGSEFRSRFEALLEPFVKLEAELKVEQDRYARIWAARAKQLDKAKRALLGLRGDLEGIAGNALPGAPALELPAVDEEPPALA